MDISLVRFCQPIVLMIIFASSVSVAGITEVRTISEVPKKIRSVYFVDVDNTWISAQGNKGTDAWFGHHWDLFKRVSDPDPYGRALGLWIGAQSQIQILPVEHDTVQFTQDLQANGNLVFGLTSREPALSTLTLAQLMDVGIEPSNPFEDVSISRMEHEDMKEDAAFIHGVFYVGGNDKGKALGHLFKKLEFQPESVTFIDDKRRHVENVEQMCLSLKIAFDGFRYAALDEKVASFQETVISRLLELTDLQEKLDFLSGVP